MNKKEIIILSSLFALVAIGGIIFFISKFIFSRGGFDDNLAEKVRQTFIIAEDPFNGLKGEIYLTLAEKNDDVTDLYVLNVLDKKITRLDPFDEVGSKFIQFTNKYSPQNSMMAYMSARRPLSGSLSLRVWDRSLGTSFAIRGSPLWFKRLPQWSPDGQKIVFTGAEQKSSFNTINEWGVYVVGLKGGESYVTHGTYPHWSPKGNKLIFLRSDGLYVYDFTNNESVQAYPLAESYVKINTKLGVSGDGSLLALSNPNTADVSVFKILSWEPFQMQLIKRIFGRISGAAMRTDFYWPVFSPDNRYLALQAAEWDDEGATVLNPRIIVYELKNFENIVLATLDDYNFNFAFTTDWQY